LIPASARQVLPASLRQILVVVLMMGWLPFGIEEFSNTAGLDPVFMAPHTAPSKASKMRVVLVIRERTSRFSAPSQ